MKNANVNQVEALLELKNWLNGGANYNQGVELFINNGGNKALAARTLKAKGAVPANKRLLLFHIKKMISNLEKQVKLPTQSENEIPNEDKETKKKVSLPQIGLRKLYPNIKLEEAPKAIKQMFMASLISWNQLCESHDQGLEGAETADDYLAAMTAIFEAKEENKLVHAELKHFNDTGNILGKHPKLILVAYQTKMEELKKVNGAKLQKERDKCYNNFARQKKRLDDSDFKNKANQVALVNKWQNKLAICDTLLKE